MARNGSGSYSLPEAALTNGTTADATVVQSNFDDIATALTGSLAKDGQTVPTANLPMGGYKHTGVADGSARTQYATLGQLQDGGGVYAAAGGTADAITATITPAITAYAIGQTFWIKTGAGANTGAVTLNVNGLGAGAVKWPDDTALVAGDLPASAMIEVTCQAVTPVFHLMSGVRVGGLLKSGGTMTGDLTMSGASVIEAMGASVAGASTTDIWATDGGSRHITGSGATIASLGTAPQAGARMLVIMDGAHTLVHGSNLDLPGNVNRTTAAGDRFWVLAETTTAARVVDYVADSGAAGIPMVGDSGSGGTAGLAPAPAAGDADKYLTGAATYVRPARVLLATKSPSGAAAVTFVAADGFSATKYIAYEIEFTVLPATDGADLQCTFSTDGGSSWKTGATDYHWLSNYVSGAGGSVGSGNSAYIQVVDDIGNATGENASGTIKIMSRGSGLRATELLSNVVRKSSSGATVIETTTGLYAASTAIDGFRFAMSSGNMTGEFQIYGITK